MRQHFKCIKYKLLLLIIIFSIPMNFDVLAQSTTFGIIRWNIRNGVEKSIVKDKDINVTYDYYAAGVEGVYYTDDIYYRGKIYAFATAKNDDNGTPYQTTNGSFIDIVLGAYDAGDDIFSYGFGLRGDFEQNGIKTYDNGKKISPKSADIGLDFPYTYSLNDLIRINGYGSALNVWTEEKFLGGYVLDLNTELHVSPLSFLSVGAGINYYMKRTKTLDDEVYKLRAFYWNVFVGISFNGTAQSWY